MLMYPVTTLTCSYTFSNILRVYLIIHTCFSITVKYNVTFYTHNRYLSTRVIGLLLISSPTKIRYFVIRWVFVYVVYRLFVFIVRYKGISY